MIQYMKISYGVPFKIPRKLGNLFKEIVKIKGVKYIKQQGFVIEDKSSLDAVNRILIKMGLVLVPKIYCYVCGGEVDCENCEFKDICKKDVKYCICKKCLSSHDIVKKYAEKQRLALFKFTK